MNEVKLGQWKFLPFFLLPFLAVALNSHPGFATCTTDSNTGVVTCTESASASVTVAEACTLTANTSPAHTATLANGIYSATTTEYASGIGKTTLKVVCNDASGFSIYAVGYTNNEYGNTKLMSNEQDATAPIINTGTASSGNTSAWSMKLTSVTGTYAPTLDNSFGSYHSVPSTYTRVAYRTSGTDVQVGSTEATGSSVDTTYAAFISPTQPAGTYVGKVKYTLVHPNTNTPKDAPIDCPANSICYGANANDVEGTMGIQTKRNGSGTNNITSNVEATLLASNFSRKGYGFAGWSKSQKAASDPTAKIYGPNETITTGDVSNKGISLYAVWVKSTGNIQNWSGCSSLASGAVTALTDQRDDDTYAVAKLADGNCWMIENLRLDHTAAHNSDGSLAQSYGASSIYGHFEGLAAAESHYPGSATANTLYSTDGSNDTISIDDSNYPRFRMPRYNNWNTPTAATDRPSNPDTNSAINDVSNAGIYGYSNYYTWSAALANTIYYGGPTAVDANGKTSETVKTSLCPKGWKLPYGRDTGRGATSGGFSYLDIQLGGTGTNQSTYASSKRWRVYPNNFLYSGNITSLSSTQRGGRGDYWSSTSKDSNSSYNLYLGSGGVYPGTVGNLKDLGLSIRCLTPGT